MDRYEKKYMITKVNEASLDELRYQIKEEKNRVKIMKNELNVKETLIEIMARRIQYLQNVKIKKQPKTEAIKH